MKKLLIKGYYSFNNFGDDILLQSILDTFSDNKKYKVTVLANQNNRIKKNNSTLFESPSKINTVKAILENDVLVYGGGSQFQDYKQISNYLNMFYNLFLVLLCKLIGKKVVHLNVSIGPINSKIGFYTYKLLFNLSNIIIVRNLKSINLLNKMLVDRKKITFSPDLAYIRDKKFIEKKDKKILGLNLLDFNLTTSNKNNSSININQKIIDFLDDIRISENIEINFLSFQNTKNICDHNNLIMDNFNLVEYNEGIEKFEQAISRCDYLITQRFHAAIYGHLNNIPQINLAYHEKCLDLMDHLEYREDAYIDIVNNQFNEQDFKKRLYDMLQNPNKYYSAKSSNGEAVKLRNVLSNLHKDLEAL